MADPSYRLFASAPDTIPIATQCSGWVPGKVHPCPTATFGYRSCGFYQACLPIAFPCLPCRTVIVHFDSFSGLEAMLDGFLSCLRRFDWTSQDFFWPTELLSCVIDANFAPNGENFDCHT